MAENATGSGTNRARLIELIKERSFQEGPAFKLASGKTSTFYFNMKPTMLDSEGAFLVASLILDQIEGNLIIDRASRKTEIARTRCSQSASRTVSE